MTDPDLSPADESRLAACGISPAEARRQLALLRHPPAPRRIVRPCTVGDGVLRLTEREADGLVQLHDDAALRGRLQRFVPASGAATRMFRDLLAYRDAARPHAPATESGSVAEFRRRIREFAFWEDLKAELTRRGLDPEAAVRAEPPIDLLAALLDEPGLGFATRPKGLIPFHRYAAASRTAFEEHLVEASALVRDATGACRAHFTVSPAERRQFEACLAASRGRLEGELATRFEVSFSEQRRSTETLSVDPEGRPLRDGDGDGDLILRPGGHGALIENLAELNADLVQIKNIDNVAYDPLSRAGIRWKKVLTGLAVRRLAEGTAGDRPLRVCGVVRNQGEPGGGPFWVAGAGGTPRPQIVESAEVDRGSAEQRRIFDTATHFNPVDMVCALRDRAGRAYDLAEFIDPEAVIVTRKSWEGRELVALERPGLWNGAMAGWETIFVEVPGETFTPVKTVLDLLRAEHLAPRRG